jgi:hypothetical protein
LLWVLFLGSFTLRAQEVAEYFIDVDPGFGKAERILLDSNLEAELLISFADVNLSPGMHQIGIRVNDDSLQWGLTSYKNFYVPNSSLQQGDNEQLAAISYEIISSEQSLAKAEWFFEPGSDSLEESVVLPLSEGFFSLRFSAISTIGKQSFQQKTYKYLPSKPLQNDSLFNADIGSFKVQTKQNSWLFGINAFHEADSSLALSEFEPGQQQIYVTPLLINEYYGFSDVSTIELAEDLFLARPFGIYPQNEAVYIPIDTVLEWQEVEGALTYQLQFALQPSLEALIADTSLGLITIYDLKPSSLSKGQTYYWRVRAIGEKVNSPWIDWQSFITKRALPDSVTLLSPINERVQVSVSPTFNWERNERARSYNVQLDSDSLFLSELLVDSVAITDTLWTFPDSLAFDSFYFWRIRAENESGYGAWSIPQKFKTQKAPPIQPILAFPRNGLTNSETEAQLRWEAAAFAESYDVQVAKSASFQNQTAIFTNVTDTTVRVENLAFFTNYYWRVRAVNATSASNWSATFSFKTRPFIAPLATSPAVAALSASADVSQPTAYRLVSLPGDYEELAVSSVFADIGSVNDTWMVYTDTGAEQNYLVSQQSSALFFEPGKALWYLSKAAVMLDYNFAAPKVTSDLSVSIPLRAGWNLIGSPLNQEVYPWSVVRQYNATAQPIWDYQGRWLQSEDLIPMRGYYFFNDLGLDSLKLPLVGLSVNNKSRLERAESSDTIQEESILTISLLDEKQNEGIATVQWNFEKNATDIPMPMQDFDQQKLWIASEAQQQNSRTQFLWGKAISSLQEKVTAHTNNRDIGLNLVANYEVEANALSDKIFRVQLSESLVDDFNQHEKLSHAMLSFDNTEVHSILTLSELVNYRFQLPNKAGRVSLKFGSQQQLQKELDNQLPKQFEIAKIYPNPFNPRTQIVINIPQDDLVRLDIFDLNGRLVQTLVDQNLTAGTHQIPWDASSVATGIYWVRLQSMSTGIQDVQKLTLMR